MVLKWLTKVIGASEVQLKNIVMGAFSPFSKEEKERERRGQDKGGGDTREGESGGRKTGGVSRRRRKEEMKEERRQEERRGGRREPVSSDGILLSLIIPILEQLMNWQEKTRVNWLRERKRAFCENICDSILSEVWPNRSLFHNLNL